MAKNGGNPQGNQPAPTKDWTVLVYLAGDNNLSTEMVWSLQELKKASQQVVNGGRLIDRVNIIAQFDPLGENPRVFDFSEDNKPACCDLEKSKAHEYRARDEWDLVRAEVEPTRDHYAVSALNEFWEERSCGRLIKKITVALNGIPCSQQKAEKFVACLLLLPEVGASKEERAARAAENVSRLAAILAEPEEPTPEARELSKWILEQVNAALGGLPVPFPCGLPWEKSYIGMLGKQPPAMQKCRMRIEEDAKRLARTSDSMLRQIRAMSTSLMIRQFINKQTELIKDGRRAKQLAVILSGHGSGAVGDFLPDDDPQSSLSIPRMGQMLREAVERISEAEENGALNAIRKLDLLGMDSCMMSMAEVCYEIQDSVKLLVGSEGFVENTGWPYRELLEVLRENVSKAGAQKQSKVASLAEGIVQQYVKFYQDYGIAGVSVDLSAIDLTKMGDIREQEWWKGLDEKPSSPAELDAQTLEDKVLDPKVKHLPSAVLGLARSLTEQLQKLSLQTELGELGLLETPTPAEVKVRDALVLAHWHAQSYKREQYTDLYDFCDQLQRFCKGDNASALTRICDWCRKIKEIINDSTNGPVLKCCFWGPEAQHSHGLSVYFPWSMSEFAPEYCHLKFARDTGWDEFLWHYLRTTLRARRFENNMLESVKPKEPERFQPRLRTNFFALGQHSFKLDQDSAAAHKVFVERRDAEAGTRKDAEAGTRKNAEVVSRRDAEAGTRKDAEAGTAKYLGKASISHLVKNVPDGFYPEFAEDGR